MTEINTYKPSLVTLQKGADDTMARLPQPGADAGNWGAILNDYLVQSHNTDGTLKAGIVQSANLATDAVTTTALANNSVTTAVLAAGSGTDGQVLVKDSTVTGGMRWDTVAPSDTGTTTVSPATTTALGTVQLAGDLSGTATMPTVPGLASKADRATTYTKTEVDTALSGKASLSTTYTKSEVDTALTAKANTATTYTKPEVDTALSGKANTADLNNYIATSQKAVAGGIATLGTDGKVPAEQLPTVTPTTMSDATTTTKGIVQLAGDLAGTASAPTVPALTTKEPLISAGTTTQYWRGDKTWQTLDKAAVGLANVDNTSDANKPVSTAMQTALDLKLEKSALDTDAALTANSDTKIATQKATKAYIDAQIAAVNTTMNAATDVLLIDTVDALPAGTPAGTIVVVKN